VLGNGSYAICIMPVDPMSKENGGLWIDKNNFGTNKPEEAQDLIWIEAKPGDLLFMHPHLLHGSAPNTSASLHRKTLLSGFCAYGANSKAYPGAEVSHRFTLQND